MTDRQMSMSGIVAIDRQQLDAEQQRIRDMDNNALLAWANTVDPSVTFHADVNGFGEQCVIAGDRARAYIELVTGRRFSKPAGGRYSGKYAIGLSVRSADHMSGMASYESYLDELANRITLMANKYGIADRQPRLF